MIRTYNDIIQAVNSDNIDQFLKDFEVLLRSAIEFKECLVSNNIEAEGYEWTPDDKPIIHIEVK